MITDWKTNFTDLQAKDFGDLGKNNSGNISVGNHAWGFSRGGFPENACIGGAISERNFCEICRRKSAQNTEKHKTKLCAEVPERPLPKDPFSL